ncbi:hypothetical protein F3Y22_tig00111392pilonHSYRG00432 [Hibiscus syriacus]|uniref:RNase H type-1 domain-containing protein n=1 Tax=Hibiscus syriacus TaxID=106335 RepID=A0A6A2YL96_HIBSY|nr:hypothetical protein F3Y22_tig00111392pilonHSYRG00432 [Hibiscus syriacus]
MPSLEHLQGQITLITQSSHPHHQAFPGAKSYNLLPLPRLNPRITLWSPPPMNWVKVSSDEARNKEPDFVFCGGVLRNSEGAWLRGFSKFIGSCSIDDAELWGILIGLMCAWDYGASQVDFQHVNCDENRVADALAKLAQGYELNCLWFTNPPDALGPLLQGESVAVHAS